VGERKRCLRYESKKCNTTRLFLAAASMLPRSPVATATTTGGGSSSSSSSSAAAQPLKNDVKPFKRQLPILVVKRRIKAPAATRPTTRAKYAPTVVTTLQQQFRWNDNKNQAKNDNAMDMSSKQGTTSVHKQQQQLLCDRQQDNDNDGGDNNNDQEDDAAFASYDALVQTWITTVHNNNPVTMSDTALAFQSLTTQSSNNNTCLEIPLLAAAAVRNGNGNGATVVSCDNNSSSSSSMMMIRGVLECQLYNFFQSHKDDDNATTTTGSTVPVSRELDALVHARHVTVLEASIRLDNLLVLPLVVYVATPDYLRGVQAARDDVTRNTTATATATATSDTHSATTTTMTTTTSQESALWDWFVSHIVLGTGHGRVIRYEDLVQSWTAPTHANSSSSSLSSLESWLRQCQTEWNILRAADDSTMHTAYQWWLPAWGAVVVPALAQAAQRVVRWLKQTSQRRRQLSLHNLVTKLQNPRSPISIRNLVLPWLVDQGVVQCISRPSGTFVQLC
jgi:hypothetical protein